MSKASKAKHSTRGRKVHTPTPTRKSKTAKPVPGKTTPTPTRQNSKLADMIALLRRPQGATLEQMMKATDWQVHSVRGAMSGALKKKRGLNITSTKTDKTRVYRIEAGSAE
jgi:hypothetical protein